MTDISKGLNPLLFLLLLLATSVQARPPHHHESSTARSERAVRLHEARAAAHAVRAAEKALLAAGDPQTLVTLGKRLPFYDPADLSQSPIISAPSAIVIDADTGQTLWAKNADEKRYPASTTKILTALLFIEHSKPDDVITCTDPKITEIEPSSLHIQPGETFTAQDLLYGFLLRSANDGAVVVAEHVAGSVPAFAAMMNARAAQIGCRHSHFVTPNGLHDPNHYTTARDMAMIAREAMRNPRFEDAVGTPERFITRSIFTQDEKIVSKVKNTYFERFDGADGVKTGYTHQAGHCFVGSATRDGRRLLSVVYGSHHSGVTDTIPLLDWAFQRFPADTFAARNSPNVAVDVPGAAHPVATIAGGDLHATYDRLKPAGRNGLRSEVVPLPNVVVPIQRGEAVATLIARGPNGADLAETPLLAAENVGRSPTGLAHTPVGSTLIGILAAGVVGAACLLRIRFRYGTASAKGSRRRRSGVPPPRRGTDRVG